MQIAVSMSSAPYQSISPMLICPPKKQSYTRRLVSYKAVRRRCRAGVQRQLIVYVIVTCEVNSSTLMS